MKQPTKNLKATIEHEINNPHSQHWQRINSEARLGAVAGLKAVTKRMGERLRGNNND